MTRAAVAIIYDKFLVQGGGERVCEMLVEAFPDARLYALNARPRAFWEAKLGRKVISPPLGSLFRSRFLVSALYPLAALLMRLVTVRADVVIAYSSSCGKFARIKSGRSILYSNYPNRGLYQPEKVIGSPVLRALLAPAMALMRPIERRRLRRFDRRFSISDASRRAMLDFAGLNSEILMPPFNEQGISGAREMASAAGEADYFVLVSRLEPEKDVGYVIDAFRGSPHRLKVIGTGSLLSQFRRTAPENVELPGYVDDTVLARELAGAQALIFPSDIEYSLVPIEAVFLGTPVISFAAPSMREILIDVEGDNSEEGAVPEGNAVFYTDRSVAALTGAIERFGRVAWDTDAVKRGAVRFGRAAFIDRIRAIVDDPAPSGR